LKANNKRLKITKQNLFGRDNKSDYINNNDTIWEIDIEIQERINKLKAMENNEHKERQISSKKQNAFLLTSPLHQLFCVTKWRQRMS
jgi:hypothetical protein